MWNTGEPWGKLNMHMKLVGILSTTLLTVQTVQPNDISLISQIERTGLLGALIVAVIMLWKKIERTEAEKAKLVEKLVESTDAVKEFRLAVEKLRK